MYAQIGTYAVYFTLKIKLTSFYKLYAIQKSKASQI